MNSTRREPPVESLWVERSIYNFSPLTIIMFQTKEVRHKSLYGCRKKRLNTGTFYYNH